MIWEKKKHPAGNSSVPAGHVLHSGSLWVVLRTSLFDAPYHPRLFLRLLEVVFNGAVASTFLAVTWLWEPDGRVVFIRKGAIDPKELRL